MGKFSNVMVTLNEYFNGFLKAYIQDQVPTGASYPYLTYTVGFENEFEDNLIQVRIYAKEDSTKQIRLYTDNVIDDIGFGKVIKCKDGGSIWLKAGSPFAQIVSDNDITIKSSYINIIANYLI